MVKVAVAAEQRIWDGHAERRLIVQVAMTLGCGVLHDMNRSLIQRRFS